MIQQWIAHLVYNFGVGTSTACGNRKRKSAGRENIKDRLCFSPFYGIILLQ
jgi:hypothetical protein